MLSPMRSGTILVVVLVACALIAIAGFAFIGRSNASLRTGAWNRDHLILRLLAESAAEELFVRAQEGANDATDRTYAALRAGAAKKDAPPVLLPWLKPDTLVADAKALSTGAKIEVLPPAAGAFVQVLNVVRMSPDPSERMGILRVDVALTMGGRLNVVERVRVEHAFKIARTGPPRLPPLPGPTGTAALVIGTSERATLPNFVPADQVAGPPVYAPCAKDGCTRADGAYRSLSTMLSSATPEGLARVPAAAAPPIAVSTGLYAPATMSQRAHYVTTSADQLYRFLIARRKQSLPVHGVIHNQGKDPLAIAFSTPFAGNCVISSAGRIDVGDVKLADPRVDSLTLVSPSRVLVQGRSVEASLVCSGPGSEGVVFRQRAQVLGPVISAVFPKGAGLSVGELSQCQIGANPYLDCLPGAPSGGPGFAPYYAVFSPNPILVEHARE